ncbi:MAG: class I SAM-dependent methyltransferase [Chitinophagaceae bacterium]|nr:MAG: class I SAM-dependent methyltransferase [Chitinophagaceae bacterium]
MYSRSQLAKKYIRYYFTALNGKGHGVHSPFVFNFIKFVMNDKTKYPEYALIENQRSKLLKDHSDISVVDFGAGPSGNTSAAYQKTDSGKIYTRKTSEIARKALKSKKFGQLLFRVVRYYQPALNVELGTSLGITSCYIAAANKKGYLHSFEGAETVARKAKENFGETGISNISLITGNIDQTLLPALAEIGKADFVFMDGNHRFEPTTRYFNEMLPYLHEYSIVILDDIHWSKEMEDAWEQCRKHESVTLSIDLFYIGLLFFRKEFKVPQNFIIRF